MNKLILVSILLILVATLQFPIILFSQNQDSHREITLDEFMSRYMDNYEIEKRVALEGYGSVYSVVKNTGDIIASTIIGDDSRIYYFESNLELQWLRDIENLHVSKINASDNGELITIGALLPPSGRKYYDEGIRNILFDKNGELKAKIQMDSNILIPFPSGDYLHVKVPFYSNEKKFCNVFDLHGNPVELHMPNELKGESVLFKFIDESKAFIMHQDMGKSVGFGLVEIEGDSIGLLWDKLFEYDDTPMFEMKFATTGSAFNEKYLCAASPGKYGGIVCFDMEGKLVYSDGNGYVAYVGILSDYELLLVKNHPYNNSQVINLKT